MSKLFDHAHQDVSLFNIALVGNPNSGKSTLFNSLTGLHQKTGNFPGVTVDKKSGFLRLKEKDDANVYHLIDLPGIYSLYPKSLDEKVTADVLLNKKGSDYPNCIIAVADATNLKRSLLLVSQLIDLQIPLVVVLNMSDEAIKNGVHIDTDKLKMELGVPVLLANSRKGEGIEEIKEALKNINSPQKKFIDSEYLSSTGSTDYFGYIAKSNKVLNSEGNAVEKRLFKDLESKDTIARFDSIRTLIKNTVSYTGKGRTYELSERIDRYTTHPFWGFIIFMIVLFFVFQSIFFLAEFPMGWIEDFFSWAGQSLSQLMPTNNFSNLLINGILAGLSGVVVFVPQIALLFGFISLLEDSGYMARVSFIMDRLMRQVGLNGRSVIPLISGVACAVPAIMSTRTISNVKERLITILITPLMSCSARLPVYTLLIAMLVPEEDGHSFFNKKGLVLLGMYLLGFFFAVIVALVLKIIMKAKEKSYFIMELPVYRSPQAKTVFITMFDKVKVFLVNAGKIIVAISIVLWFLTSFGPGDHFSRIDQAFKACTNTSEKNELAAKRLEASYAGIIGKKIEPAIAPLGFDWKIGISLITSFAAREVFVGTMATIYSAGEEGNVDGIRHKMMKERNADGSPRYNAAVCWSLLIFYAFAMQCISTIAVVKRETKTWRWPLIQLVYMSALAYMGSLVVYSLLS